MQQPKSASHTKRGNNYSMQHHLSPATTQPLRLYLHPPNQAKDLKATKKRMIEIY